MGRVIKAQKDLYICFVDSEKVFKKVQHQDLFGILEKVGLNGKDLRLIRNLYWN